MIEKLKHETIKYTRFNAESHLETSRKVILMHVTISDKSLSIPKIAVEFKVDTGAATTIIPARDLGIAISEEEYIKKFKPRARLVNGIVKNAKVNAYYHKFDALCIGDIVLKDTYISIIFDKNVNSKLLGMDILGLFDITISSTNRTITFLETEELFDITSQNRSIGYPEDIGQLIDFGLLEDGKSSKRITIQDLQANYIHSMLK